MYFFYEMQVFCRKTWNLEKNLDFNNLGKKLEKILVFNNFYM